MVTAIRLISQLRTASQAPGRINTLPLRITVLLKGLVLATFPNMIVMPLARAVVGCGLMAMMR